MVYLCLCVRAFVRASIFVFLFACGYSIGMCVYTCPLVVCTMFILIFINGQRSRPLHLPAMPPPTPETSYLVPSTAVIVNTRSHVVLPYMVYVAIHTCTIYSAFLSLYGFVNSTAHVYTWNCCLCVDFKVVMTQEVIWKNMCVVQ